MISVLVSSLIIYAACALGLLYAFINYRIVHNVEVKGDAENEYTQLNGHGISSKQAEQMIHISGLIANGANTFLYQEYKILAIFCALMAILIFFTVDAYSGVGTTLAFIFGTGTSVLSGFLGMRIAVAANFRTAFKCKDGIGAGFILAFRAGCVMGFSLVSLSLLMMTTLVLIYRAVYDSTDYKSLYEAIAGYGLGGSTIALFGRVGGGIYTKAADVGADLVGKVEEAFAEDSPKNPATIADNVGDNVGDIAGMGSDLFGSFAEATCAALVVLASNPVTQGDGLIPTFAAVPDDNAYMFLPFMLSAFGILSCFFTTFAATNFMAIHEAPQDQVHSESEENKANKNLNAKVESVLKWQLIISTIILLGALYVAALLTVGISSTDANLNNDSNLYLGCYLSGTFESITVYVPNPECFELSPFNVWLCAASGLVAGLFIGLLTDYYTSNAHGPTIEVAMSCKTGAATNIIYGLALGYLSVVLPVFLLSITAYVSHKTLGMLGLALAALGMLSNLSVGLAIDAYGPISDNAGGIAEMSELHAIRDRTDALDAAGNTTAAIGKGFAIGSAALVSMSLYGAFITRVSSAPPGNHSNPIILLQSDVTITDALVFSGLLIGAMLPYWFSAMTMKSVGKAANQMVVEIRNQLRENPGIRDGTVAPNYNECVRISTAASLKEMIGPGAMVILTPIIVGVLFGPKAVAGLLPGALVSGVQLAISASNTGGAWDNAKKFVENGRFIEDGKVLGKHTDVHKAAVIGDTVGDPLKDTSGPSLNILIKLSAILSLVFAPFFQITGVLCKPLNENQ